MKNKISECDNGNALPTCVPVKNSCQVTWFSVVNSGNKIESAKYKCTLGSESFYLQLGYEALRQMHLSDGNCLNIHCKLETDEEGDIIYRCFSCEEPLHMNI